MGDHRLTRTQKNAIYQFLQKNDVSPAHFKWETLEGSGGNQYSRIRHISENCFFDYGWDVSVQNGSGLCSYRPGGVAVLFQDWIGPGAILPHASRWAQYVAQELAEPDLWAQLESYSLEIPDASREQLDSAPLLEADRKRIRLVLDQVRERAKQSSLAPDQLDVVNAKLDYLMESANRVTLKDWANIVLATLMTMAVDAAIDKELYQTIIEPLWNLIVSGVRLLTG